MIERSTKDNQQYILRIIQGGLMSLKTRVRAFFYVCVYVRMYS